jgi:hypothetical protein
VGRNVDISVDIVLADSFNDSLGTLNMHILQREVPEDHLASRPCSSVSRINILSRVIAADQVENSIRVSNASLDRWGVSKVVLLEYGVTGRLLTISGVIEAYDEDNAAKISGDLEMTLGHLLTEGNNDGASLAS